ncbi:MAG: hypothetical protein ACOY45_14080 [Pseudomonadota bacterium]
MFRYAVPAALLVAACATTAASDPGMSASQQAKLDKALAGLEPGKPQNCIDPDRITQTKTFPDTILFVVGKNKVYRNTPTGGCAGLKRDDLIVTRSPIRQYCSGDLVETRARVGGQVTGACALGDFVPYTPAAD